MITKEKKKLKETINLSSSEGKLVIQDGFFQKYATKYNNLYITQNNAPDLDIDYYLSHSGEKKISSIFSKWFEMLDPHSPEHVEGLTMKPVEKLIDVVHNKFSHKWDQIYQALITNNYSILNNYGITETHSEITGETNNATHIIDEEHTVNSETSVNTNTTTTTSDKNHGFNSNNSVPTTESIESVAGSSDDNKTFEDTTKTIDGNNRDTENKSGSKTYTHSVTGYKDRDPEEAIEQEISLRSKRVFYEIIMNDVDTVLCLQIY